MHARAGYRVMNITSPSNSTPPVPPPVTIDQVCDALDAAGFDALDDFPQGVSVERGAYLLASEQDLRVVDFAGGYHYLGVDEDGCACLGADTIDNLDELQRLVTAWSEVEGEQS